MILSDAAKGENAPVQDTRPGDGSVKPWGECCNRALKCDVRAERC